MGTRLPLAALALSIACAPQDQPRPNRTARVAAAPSIAHAPVCAARLVTPDSVGPLRIDLPADSIRLVCPVVRDTSEMVPDPVVPGHSRPVRQVHVALPAGNAVATVESGHVSEIRLAGAPFATADSLGIGTPLAKLLDHPGVGGYVAGGRLYVEVPSTCAIRFRVAAPLGTTVDATIDSASLRRLVPSSPVDELSISFCRRYAREDLGAPVRVDSVLLARDLDSSGALDYVVRESRGRGDAEAPRADRIALYLDRAPRSGKAAWTSKWDDEFGSLRLDSTYILAPSTSLLMFWSNEGDYSGAWLLLVHRGIVREEILLGVDYGQGFLDVTQRDGRTIVDASQDHLTVRGAALPAVIACKPTQWAGVVLEFDPDALRFRPGRPRCVPVR